MTLNKRNNIRYGMPSQNCMKKDVLNMSLALFVTNSNFVNWSWDLTFWLWIWPWVMKILQEVNCSVKITWKWGITLVPGFICWKIIFDFEIYGGHLVFALKKIRPKVPKWNPADSCSEHPLEQQSIIKHRPYRETRLSKKISFGNWTINDIYGVWSAILPCLLRCFAFYLW